MKNNFLTDIAKEYNSKIEGVFFRTIEEKNHYGLVSKTNRGTYRIFLDQEKHKCSYHTIFILFHEIGHVILNNFNDPYFFAREMSADHWALKELDIIDSENNVFPEYRNCYKCFFSVSSFCHNKEIYIQSTLQKAEYFFCNRAQCRLKLSVCIKRQKYFTESIIESDYDVRACSIGCSRRRDKCKLKLQVCLKSPKSHTRVTLKEPFIICKKCPQGHQNLKQYNENYMQ